MRIEIKDPRRKQKVDREATSSYLEPFEILFIFTYLLEQVMNYAVILTFLTTQNSFSFVDAILPPLYSKFIKR